MQSSLPFPPEPLRPAAQAAGLATAAPATIGMPFDGAPGFIRNPAFARFTYWLRDVWWLNPSSLILFLLVPLYLSFSAFDFSKVVPNTYIPSWIYVWGLVLLVAMAAGAKVGGLSSTPRRLAPNGAGLVKITIPSIAMAVLLGASVMAYVVWFAPLLQQPQLLLAIVTEGRTNVRGDISTTPGITTLTQCAVGYYVGYAIKQGSNPRSIQWWEHLGFWLLLALALFRAFAWSERLAVIELAVSYGVARTAFIAIRSPVLWSGLGLMPVVGAIALYLLFTLAEYFRSWHYYQQFYNSVWAFSYERLLTYYATASNNGIGLLVESNNWPNYTGRFIAEWIYLMPVTGEYMRDYFGDAIRDYNIFLRDHARVEFNNWSGMFPIVFDIGYLGSALYFVAIGLIIGRLWKGWKKHELGGLLFYPSCALFLLEMLRFNYFAATRFFPVALSLLFLYAVARWRTRSLYLPYPSSTQRSH